MNTSYLWALDLGVESGRQIFPGCSRGMAQICQLRNAFLAEIKSFSYSDYVHTKPLKCVDRLARVLVICIYIMMIRLYVHLNDTNFIWFNFKFAKLCCNGQGTFLRH